ncbi:LCP family protein [Streptomyces cyaneofuscatus]|uniref:LCP family glycopolymer transferase n=1 Tax=Streptomyces cyaneofuscatus TaxID=66883 RepID=UPI003682FDD6
MRLDHYAEIDFAGFVHIVDAVGGVPMCLVRAAWGGPATSSGSCRRSPTGSPRRAASSPRLGAGLDSLLVDRDMDLRTLAGMFRSVREAGAAGSPASHRPR